MKKVILILIILAVAGLGWYMYESKKTAAILNDPNFTHGNGRIEATEVNIATKLAGKIEVVNVREGDFVKKNDKIAKIQTNVLEAQLAQANAMILVKKAELVTAQADVLSQASLLKQAQSHYERISTLEQSDAASRQNLENAEANYETAQAALASAQAKVKKSEAEIVAAEADAKRIQADIDDSTLNTPIDGRIQYRIAEPGEVLNAGGRVVNLVDLTDVYMTFFVSEEAAGKIPLNAEARICVDALPGVAIPANVSYVANVAQFTPKTVETLEERQKLMFRVKARIRPELLQKYIEDVKTGLPGNAWVRLNENAEWPDFLKNTPENEAK